MRKLAWFAGGFGAACLLLCYRAPRWLFAAFTGLFLLSLLVWLALRPRRSEHTDLSLFPRRRRISFHIFRRAAALFLGTLLASAWFSAYSALFYLPAAELSGTERTVSATVTTWPEETSIGGYSLSLRLDGDFRSPDVLLYGSAAWGGVRPGDRVTCELRLEDSVFAFGKETTYYTARGLFLLGYCDEAPVLSRPDRVPLRHWPVLCAHALKEGIHAAFDSAAAPLAAAVTLGDKTGLPAAPLRPEPLRYPAHCRGVRYAHQLSGRCAAVFVPGTPPGGALPCPGADFLCLHGRRDSLRLSCRDHADGPPGRARTQPGE